MLSIILSSGPVTLYSLGFLMAIGAFLLSFISWRRLRELGLEEEKVLDFIIITLLFGFFFARLLFVLEHFNKFGLSFLRWFLFVRYPGFSFWGWILGFFLSLNWFARKEKWNLFRVADEITFGALPFLILIQLGQFLDGSGFGRFTNMPWGIYSPGSLLKRHPVSLFMAILLFLIWSLLIKTERHWRTWNWLKNRESGFVSLIALILTFLVSIPLAFLGDSKVYFYWLKIGLMVVFFILTTTFFYGRVGHSLKKLFIKKDEQNEEKQEEKQEENK